MVQNDVRLRPLRDAREALGASTEVMIAIVLAESRGVVSGAVRRFLEADSLFHVVAEAGDLDTAIRKVLGYKPDVVVVDDSISETPLAEALPRFAFASPRTAVVLLTERDDPDYARALMREGAHALVLKQGRGRHLVDAVRAAASGHQYLSPELGARVAVDPETSDLHLRGLTERQIEILRLVAEGYTNPEIADHLELSVRTVEAHRSHLMHKIKARSRAGVCEYARAAHLTSASNGHRKR